MNDDRLDAILSETLKRDAVPQQANEAAALRVLTRLGALPRQKMPLWRLPGILLDWEFAPAWPRVAALASCAVLGFAIGIAGLDQRPNPSAAPYSFVSGADFGSIALPSGSQSGDEP
jgi:hypothetical protein